MNKIFKEITNDDIFQLLIKINDKLAKINGTVKWHDRALWALFLIVLGIIGGLIAIN